MSSTLDIRGIITFMLKNPEEFPGIHNYSQPRTTQGLLPIDPTRQMLLIWDALVEYLKEKLDNASGVNVPGLGAFLLEPTTEVADPRVAYDRDREVVKPAFVIAPALQTALFRYKERELVRGQYRAAGNTVYGLGRKTVIFSPIPIAAACYLRPEVITQGLNALWRAMKVLIDKDYDLTVDFKFCKLQMVHRNLKVLWRGDVKASAQATLDSRPIVGTGVSQNWTRSKLPKSMMNFLPRPDSPGTTQAREKNAALAVMSLDMASISAAACVQAHPSATGGGPKVLTGSVFAKNNYSATLKGRQNHFGGPQVEQLTAAGRTGCLQTIDAQSTLRALELEEKNGASTYKL